MSNPWLVKRHGAVFSYCETEQQARALASGLNSQYQTDEYYPEAYE